MTSLDKIEREIIKQMFIDVIVAIGDGSIISNNADYIKQVSKMFVDAQPTPTVPKISDLSGIMDFPNLPPEYFEEPSFTVEDRVEDVVQDATPTVTGDVEVWKTIVCRTCDGNGWDITYDPSDPTGATPMQVECEDCHAEGKYMTLDAVRTLITTIKAQHEAELRKSDDLLDDMWGLICNVNGGILEKETEEWYTAFKRIREKYFASLTPKDSNSESITNQTITK